MKRSPASWKIVGPLLLAVFAVTCAVPGSHSAVAQTNETVTPAGDAGRGKALFVKAGCYECHGTVGQGNYFTAPRLAPHPLPYAALVAYIRKPAGNMPAYAATVLPDRDAADIYAYLASIPAAKSAAQIPLLSGTTLKAK